jgi:superfamily I DNA/RNA helicase
MIGRSKVLKTVFRNSARVWVFSAFLQEEKASYVRDKSAKLKFTNKGGYDPQLIECKDMDAQVDKAVELVQKIIQGGQAARNILIIYRHKNIPETYYPVVEKLTARLNRRKIPNEWISQDTEAKRTFNWDAETVKISTVQSAKGMDSPIVIILGAETYRSDFTNNEYDETRMMYVALTRAREFLVVLYSGDKGMVPALKNSWQNYLKYRDAIIKLETPSS